MPFHTEHCDYCTANALILSKSCHNCMYFAVKHFGLQFLYCYTNKVVLLLLLLLLLLLSSPSSWPCTRSHKVGSRPPPNASPLPKCPPVSGINGSSNKGWLGTRSQYVHVCYLCWNQVGLLRKRNKPWPVKLVFFHHQRPDMCEKGEVCVYI